MPFAETLEKLSNACGVAGRGEEVRSLMKKFLKPYVDEVREDKLGNVIGIRRGKKDAPIDRSVSVCLILRQRK